jgi:hypothetical protein
MRQSLVVMHRVQELNRLVAGNRSCGRCLLLWRSGLWHPCMRNLSSPAALEPFKRALGALVPARELLGDHHSRGFTGEQALAQGGALEGSRADVEAEADQGIALSRIQSNAAEQPVDSAGRFSHVLLEPGLGLLLRDR